MPFSTADLCCSCLFSSPFPPADDCIGYMREEEIENPDGIQADFWEDMR